MTLSHLGRVSADGTASALPAQTTPVHLFAPDTLWNARYLDAAVADGHRGTGRITLDAVAGGGTAFRHGGIRPRPKFPEGLNVPLRSSASAERSSAAPCARAASAAGPPRKMRDARTSLLHN